MKEPVKAVFGGTLRGKRRTMEAVKNGDSNENERGRKDVENRNKGGWMRSRTI